MGNNITKVNFEKLWLWFYAEFLETKIVLLTQIEISTRRSKVKVALPIYPSVADPRGQFGTTAPTKRLWRPLDWCSFAINAPLFGACGSRNRDGKYSKSKFISVMLDDRLERKKKGSSKNRNTIWKTTNWLKILQASETKTRNQFQGCCQCSSWVRSLSAS